MKEQFKQQFREDEVALIKHWDKKNNEWVTNVHPKIGGRLRLEEPDILPLTYDQIQMILDAVDPWYKPYVAVAFFTGMRV